MDPAWTHLDVSHVEPQGGSLFLLLVTHPMVCTSEWDCCKIKKRMQATVHCLYMLIQELILQSQRLAAVNLPVISVRLINIIIWIISVKLNLFFGVHFCRKESESKSRRLSEFRRWRGFSLHAWRRQNKTTVPVRADPRQTSTCCVLACWILFIVMCLLCCGAYMSAG